MTVGKGAGHACVPTTHSLTVIRTAERSLHPRLIICQRTSAAKAVADAGGLKAVRKETNLAAVRLQKSAHTRGEIDDDGATSLTFFFFDITLQAACTRRGSSF
jgi:hypothetical protein